MGRARLPGSGTTRPCDRVSHAHSQSQSTASAQLTRRVTEVTPPGVYTLSRCCALPYPRTRGSLSTSKYPLPSNGVIISQPKNPCFCILGVIFDERRITILRVPPHATSQMPKAHLDTVLTNPVVPPGQALYSLHFVPRRYGFILGTLANRHVATTTSCSDPDHPTPSRSPLGSQCALMSHVSSPRLTSPGPHQPRSSAISPSPPSTSPGRGAGTGKGIDTRKDTDGKLAPRWHDGIWLGLQFTSGEHIVATSDGRVVRARAVHPRPDAV